MGILPTTSIVLLILFTAPIVLLFTLFTLFVEFRVGKARAKRLEEDLRSHRNCRHIYALLADAAGHSSHSITQHNAKSLLAGTVAITVLSPG